MKDEGRPAAKNEERGAKNEAERAQREERGERLKVEG